MLPCCSDTVTMVLPPLLAAKPLGESLFIGESAPAVILGAVEVTSFILTMMRQGDRRTCHPRSEEVAAVMVLGNDVAVSTSRFGAGGAPQPT